VWLFGLIEQRKGTDKGFGRSKIFVMPNRNTETIQGYIQKHVKPGSMVYHDGFKPY
jgi:hypothetical protein